MTEIKTEHFKKLLENELDVVESELKSVGRKNPENRGDWEAVPPSIDDTMSSDNTEMADRMEVYEENTGILKQLEIRYNEILSALERIEDGTFGVCQVGGEIIEHDRLEANPAATTCKKHMN